MKNKSVLINFFIAAIFVATVSFSGIADAQTKADSVTVADAKWETSPLQKGMTYFHLQFKNLYGGPQNICMIEISPRSYKFGFKDNGGMAETSVKATEAGAVAATNGTFFDMKKGNSVAYLQIDGNIIDTTEKGIINPLMTGAVKIVNGKISVIDWSPEIEKNFRAIAKNAAAKNHMPCRLRHTSVMASLPRLLKKGYECPVPPVLEGFVYKKHPRTAVFTKKGKVYLLVVDGRAKGNAEGMTIQELQHFLRVYGAFDAMNMDGGGSSTIWYRGNGVLNMPSDNDKFDHAGERKVSDEICVFPR
jgi:exopolysaccharide biosynthesis protein